MLCMLCIPASDCLAKKSICYLKLKASLYDGVKDFLEKKFQNSDLAPFLTLRKTKLGKIKVQETGSSLIKSIIRKDNWRINKS